LRYVYILIEGNKMNKLFNRLSSFVEARAHYTTELPYNYNNILVVNSLKEMREARDHAPEGVNCIIYRRGELSHDFKSFAQALNMWKDKNSHKSYRTEDYEADLPPHFRDTRLALEQDISDFKAAFTLKGEQPSLTVRTLDHQGYLKYQPEHTKTPGEKTLFDMYHADTLFWRGAIIWQEGTEYIRDEDAKLISEPGKIPLYEPKLFAPVHRLKEGDIALFSGYLQSPNPFIHRHGQIKKGDVKLAAFTNSLP